VNVLLTIPTHISGTMKNVSVIQWSVSKGSSADGGAEKPNVRYEVLQTEEEFPAAALPFTVALVASSSIVDT
jgi:hypothetical protein